MALPILSSSFQLNFVFGEIPQWYHWPGHAKGTGRGFVAEASPLRAGEGGGRKAARAWELPSTACPQGHWQAADIGHGVAQEGEVPTGPRCIQGNIPSATPHMDHCQVLLDMRP